MFNKLKKKFVIINMLLLTTVFIGIFGTIYVTNIVTLKRDTKFMLNSLVEPEPQHKPTPKKPYIGNYIIAELDNNNNLIKYFSPFNLEDSTTTELINSVLSKKKLSGDIYSNNTNYSYLVKYTPLGTKIAFIDNTPQQTILSNLLKTFIIIGFLSLGVLLIISIYLTNRTIKPIEESFNKQKQFIADASHELRTPLTIIKTNLSLVLSNKDDKIKNQSKWLNYINLQADRMSSLIDEMLTLAKLDNVNEDIAFPSFNISNVLEHLILTFEALIYEKNITLESNISDNILIYGNTKNIQKLFSILLDNAIKNTPEKGIITIELSSNNNEVLITFKNTGNGIPSENIDKIFERFYRVDSSRNSSIDGYGLGLSIAKSIVKAHKGKIYATSEVNKDCKFTIELPKSKGL